MPQKQAESRFEFLRRVLRLETDDAIDEACRFLESRGQKFCVEFGTDNAVDKAIEILDREIEGGQ